MHGIDIFLWRHNFPSQGIAQKYVTLQASIGRSSDGNRHLPQVLSGFLFWECWVGTINVNGERAVFWGQRLIRGWVLDQQGDSLPASDAS